MNQENDETAISYEYESSSPVLNSKRRWSKRLRPLIHDSLNLPELYKNVFAHIKGKKSIERDILENYLKTLDEISLQDFKSQWFVKKIKGLVKYALKPRKSFNDSLCDGEIILMQAPVPKSNIAELQLVYHELSECLKQKNNCIPRRKLRSYLEKYSHYHENEEHTLELLLKIRGILKYLLLTRDDFITRLATGDIILYDASEKPIKMSLTAQNEEAIAYHLDKRSNEMEDSDITVDLPLDMLSNNNFGSKGVEISENYSRDMFSDSESLYGNSSQMLLKSQNLNEIFKTPLAPQVKPTKKCQSFTSDKANRKYLPNDNNGKEKTDYIQLPQEFASKVDVESPDMFAELESLHEESQKIFETCKDLTDTDSGILKKIEPAHKSLEEAYNGYYNLASSLKTTNSVIVIDNDSALLNTQSIKNDCQFFEERQPFKNKFESRISLKEAAKKVRDNYKNNVQFLKTDFLATLERLSISEGMPIKSVNLNTSDVTMVNDYSFDDREENLKVFEKIGEEMKKRLIERNVINS